MLPGWYGFSKAVQTLGIDDKTLQDMISQWGFFDVFLSNMEMALAKKRFNRGPALSWPSQ